MKSVFVAGWVLKAPLCVPWAVLTLRPCVVVVCVLNTCSPYPCHSGHRITLHRRLPGLAQLAAQEHQEHELRQPRLPQDHGGRRRRNPHRATQRVHRPRVPSSEWQPQSAILSTSSRGRHHRQQFPLVLGGADALQQQMKGSLRYCRYAGLERKNSLAHAHFHTGFINHHWGSRTFANAFTVVIFMTAVIQYVHFLIIITFLSPASHQIAHINGCRRVCWGNWEITYMFFLFLHGRTEAAGVLVTRRQHEKCQHTCATVKLREHYTHLYLCF